MIHIDKLRRNYQGTMIEYGSRDRFITNYWAIIIYRCKKKKRRYMMVVR